jgi:alpha/beta superfamily hydrolase
MGHGFGGGKEILLEQYATRFNEIGFATLIFDYRFWGDSEGTPRNFHNVQKQLEDWHSAIAYAKQLPTIDYNKIVLWGTSFAGGLVISVAAKDGSVAATISQCPMLDGLEASKQFMRNASSITAVKTGINGFYDIFKSYFGGAHYVPIVAKPGNVASMATQDAFDYQEKLRALLPHIYTREYANMVTARSLLTLAKYRPILDAPNVKCPALFIICENDTVAPAKPVEDAIKVMTHPFPVRLPMGHFDPYLGEGFKKSIEAQLEFLKNNVPIN